MMVHAYNPSTREAEAEAGMNDSSKDQGQLWLYRKILNQEAISKRKEKPGRELWDVKNDTG